MTKQYQKALAKINEATKAYTEVVKKYRALEVGDEVFLAARKAYEAAKDEFDIAYANEQKKGE